MILKNEKTEEYREISDYWKKRLFESNGFPKKFDQIVFANGPHFHQSVPQITMKYNGVTINKGLAQWGAEPGKYYYIIHIGNFIEANARVKNV